MFIKIFKNKIYLLAFIFITVWILGNIIFFACSFSDKCIFIKPDTRLTDSKYLPKESCTKKLTLGNSLLEEKDRSEVMVLTPANHHADKRYPLIIVYAPAGKSAIKSEKFYKNITSKFTEQGYIVAYVKHLPLGTEFIKDYKSIIDLIKKKYCLNSEISLLGHSDGGTISGIVGYSDINGSYKTIIMSAAGLNNKALENIACPKNKSSYLIFHNKKDFLFPSFGTENYNWLKKCFSCSKEDKRTLNNCLTPTDCNSNRVKICYNKNAHTKWNIEAGQIIEFITGGNL